MKQDKKLRCAVLGSGIAGLSLALRAAESGMRVQVFGPEQRPGSATWAAMGMNILKGGKTARSPLYEAKMAAHEQLWQRLSEWEAFSGVSIRRIRGRVYEPFFSEEQRQSIEKRVFHRPKDEYDAPTLDRMNQGEGRPGSCLDETLVHTGIGRFIYEKDYWFDPQSALRALRACLERHHRICIEREGYQDGVHAPLFGPAVEAMEWRADSSRWCLKEGAGETLGEFDYVFFAAGCFTGNLLKTLLPEDRDLVEWPWQSIAGQTLDWQMTLPGEKSKNLAQHGSDQDAVWLTAKKNIVQWSEQPEGCEQRHRHITTGGFDMEKDPLARDMYMQQAQAVLSGAPISEADGYLTKHLRYEKLQREATRCDVRWGVRAFLKDRLPVVGFLAEHRQKNESNNRPDLQRIGVSAGFHRSGTQIADACSQQLILHLQGKPTQAWFSAFAPQRWQA